MLFEVPLGSVGLVWPTAATRDLVCCDFDVSATGVRWTRVADGGDPIWFAVISMLVPLESVGLVWPTAARTSPT